MGKFDISLAPSTGNGETDWIGTPLRFSGSTKLYNPSDAGQYLWGAWMRANRFTRPQVWLGLNLNEADNFGDARGDQNAIFDGWRYMNDWMK